MYDKEYLLEKYEKCNGIYGFMYGTAFERVGGIGGDYYQIGSIEQIPKEKLILGKNKDCLVYIWGYPGPDGNIYEFSDYGKTWIFDDIPLKDPNIKVYRH